MSGDINLVIVKADIAPLKLSYFAVTLNGLVRYSHESGSKSPASAGGRDR